MSPRTWSWGPVACSVSSKPTLSAGSATADVDEAAACILCCILFRSRARASCWANDGLKRLQGAVYGGAERLATLTPRPYAFYGAGKLFSALAGSTTGRLGGTSPWLNQKEIGPIMGNRAADSFQPIPSIARREPTRARSHCDLSPPYRA